MILRKALKIKNYPEKKKIEKWSFKKNKNINYDPKKIHKNKKMIQKNNPKHKYGHEKSPKKH